jgi:hypothetical protein
MRDISKQDAFRRTRLKFVYIATLQDKALATNRPEMRDRRLASKTKLKGGQMQNQVQEDSIGDIAGSADSIGPKVYRSPVLIKHYPSYLN